MCSDFLVHQFTAGHTTSLTVQGRPQDPTSIANPPRTSRGVHSTPAYNMAPSMSLHSVTAIIILADDGSRLFAKYYTPPHHAGPIGSGGAGTKHQALV